jgi:hypothetical protein
MVKKNKTHECEGCGKKLSRSGYYKHRKKCESYLEMKDDVVRIEAKPSEDPVSFSEPDSIEWEDSEPQTINIDSDESYDDERPDWFDFEIGEEEGVTEQFPTALKWAASGATGELGKNPTKQQIEAMHNTNLQILIGALGGVDILIQSYGRAVTLDKELVVKHSSSDKEMVAHAQYNWLLEKGINPSDFVSTGTIAAALTGYYVVPPLLKIRKKSKVRFFKGAGRIGGFFSRIPLIGRFFKRKPTVPDSVMREQVGE